MNINICSVEKFN